MSATMLTVARADALFVSGLPTGSHPGRDEVDATVRAMVRCYRGSRGCAGEVAACYGEIPEYAVRRMAWARWVIASVFGGAR
ncbi:hypothetical protein ACWT_3939 [Actinoplanes sp. SE50]|uniref:hypothetical protein n=1 Tax=unclassified Actinoplanes TaxID=2626549 RepID=UPI00023ED259|nr:MULTISPECIES: hypothetical protein [unclassified Actinoplanes]AEV84963.1 hypothetical protein ACPL_4068 [Actinoplanes sp. SE50/110]ATO83354.1 hypothetical protein ACWT_3939 [Actinoplanes sp. SE50]SLM00761.1 hypothetical protein ACSP50_3994 [Actinoplanes sp. SE50/110]